MNLLTRAALRRQLQTLTAVFIGQSVQEIGMSGVAACNRLFKTLCLSASLLLCALPAQAELQLFFVHNDHLNTPKYLTDTTGKAVWQSQATPFGEVTENGDLDGDGKYVTLNMRFPGQYWDHETGTSYNYYRDYDPSLGRYVQSDPIGLRGGINTYVYVGSNPTGRFDYYGLACTCQFDKKTLKKDEYEETWWGQKRTVTAKYQCEDTAKPESQKTVDASHKEWYLHKQSSDNGREGNPLGTSYHDPVYNPYTNTFTYPQKGYDPFNPQGSGSVQLENWANSCGC